MRKRAPVPAESQYSDHEKAFHKAYFRLVKDAKGFPKNHVPEYGSKWWLPIDDVLKKIGSREKRPMLRSRKEESRYAALVWRIFGPHDLARAHIQLAFSEIASLSPENRQREIEEQQRFLENCNELRYALAEFLDIEVQLFPYFNPIMRKLSKEERQFRSRFSMEFYNCLADLDSYLDHFERWANAHYDKISPPQGGKPKSEWRHEFVSRMSHLWFLLTGEKASSGPNTLFMDFLEAAWACGGEGLPDVTWEATVRSVNSRSKGKDDETEGL